MQTITGYNTNIKHLDRICHVQTEYSEKSQPNVVTHVFIDGGRIIATRETKFGTQACQDFSRIDFVRCLIKIHHRSIVLALESGKFDTRFAANASKSPRLDVEAPLNLETVHAALRQAKHGGKPTQAMTPAVAESPTMQPMASVTKLTSAGSPTETLRSLTNFIADDDLGALVLNDIANEARHASNRSYAASA
jgi:hypothetical protein